MRIGARVLALLLLAGLGATASGQDERPFVEQAVQTELAADAADHTHWLYFEVDRKPGLTMKQWVAEAHGGDLQRDVDRNGRAVSKEEAQGKIDKFAQDSSAQAKQRKSGQHDDKQAAEMLNMLPRAFLWTKTGVEGNSTVLHFKPDPNFHPPTWESRVFAAMEGDMRVDTAQHRIASLKGRLIHDVKFGGGLLGEMEAGGTFEVERRETGKGEWQITETHVHIQGHALLFKSISEQEDDEKSKFRRLPDNISIADAEKELLAAKE
jgi:hypothetical protein